MELFKYLLICFVLAGYVESLKLDCLFQIVDYKACKVNALKVLENDIAVTSISGAYTTQIRKNDDVRGFWMGQKVVTERVPTNVCNFFKNLERFHVDGKSVKRINRGVFTSCRKVWFVALRYTSLVTLPEDLFLDLIELKNIRLESNKLVALPADLIVANPQMQTLRVINNKQLTFIDTDLPSTLTKVEFRGNDCINKNFPDDITNFEAVTNEIATKCDSPMKKSCREKLLAMEKSLSERDEEIKKLKQNKNTFEGENVDLAKDIKQLKSAIESQRIAEKEKDTSVTKLEDNLDKCNQKNLVLQENLTGIVANHKQFIEKMESSHRSKLIELNNNIDNEKVAFATNITQLMSTIEVLNVDNKNLKIAVEAFKGNNNQEFTTVKEENNILKSNNSNFRNALAEKETTVRQLSRKNEEIQADLLKCNQNIETLQTNLAKFNTFSANETNYKALLKVCFDELSTFNEINEETAKCEKTKERLEIENSSMVINIKQLKSTIESLESENAELETDCAGNEMEKSAETLKCLYENKSLKSNYENVLKMLNIPLNSV